MGGFWGTNASESRSLKSDLPDTYDESMKFGQRVTLKIPKRDGTQFDPSDLFQQVIFRTMRHINYGEGDCDFDEDTKKCRTCKKLDPQYARQEIKCSLCYDVIAYCICAKDDDNFKESATEYTCMMCSSK